MKKKFSMAMLSRTSNLTNLIYENCFRKVFKVRRRAFLPDDDYHDMQWDMKYIMSNFEGMDEDDQNRFRSRYELGQLVSKLYLEAILSLSNEQLNEILIVHNSGNLKRADNTIRAIESELTDRGIFNKRVKSDPRYSYEAMDEFTKARKQLNKEAWNKRRKAIERSRRNSSK